VVNAEIGTEGVKKGW